MLTVDIPGFKRLELYHLVLDYNGTFAKDGVLILDSVDRLKRISESLEIHVVSGDTHGTVRQGCVGLPLQVQVLESIRQDEQKKRYIESLVPRGTIAIGNGANDQWMFQVSDLALGVMGDEGLATAALLECDIVVKHIGDALDLLLNPLRLIATLRR